MMFLKKFLPTIFLFIIVSCSPSPETLATQNVEVWTPTPEMTATIIPTPTLDPKGDPDGDGISTYFEQVRGTDPFLFDSDGDSFPDYEFDEMGEYSRITTGIAIIKAPPWNYLLEHDADLNADVHQYHEILDKSENVMKIRFILFDVNNKITFKTPLEDLDTINLTDTRIEASDINRQSLKDILNKYNARNDFEAMQILKEWFLKNFQIATLSHEPVFLNGKRIDGFTIDNSWNGEELFKMKKTEACGSHAILTSYLGNNIGVPTRIVFSIPFDESGPNHFTNESYIGGNWIPIDLNWGDEINNRNPILLKLDVFRDFSDVNLSRWDYYFANTDYSPNGQGMTGLYKILMVEKFMPSK